LLFGFAVVIASFRSGWKATALLPSPPPAEMSEDAAAVSEKVEVSNDTVTIQIQPLIRHESFDHYPLPAHGKNVDVRMNMVALASIVFASPCFTWM